MPRLSACTLLVCLTLCQPAVVHATTTAVPNVPTTTPDIRDDESYQAFVARATKHPVVDDGQGHAQIAPMNNIVPGQRSLVAFTAVPDEGAQPGDDTYNIDINLLIQKGAAYTLLTNEACDVEGGSPTLRTFFYLTLSGRPTVGVICGWDASHVAADCAMSDLVRFFQVTGNDLLAVDMKKYHHLFYKQIKSDVTKDLMCDTSRFETAKDVKTLIAKAQMQ